MVRRSPVPQKKIATESPARKVAFEVLLLVEAGGYASDLLRTRCEQIDARDARLASQIVFGCVRYKAQLDFLIGHYSGRPPQKFDAEVLIALRMGIFQMRYLDRIPASAAVSQSVESDPPLPPALRGGGGERGVAQSGPLAGRMAGRTHGIVHAAVAA